MKSIIINIDTLPLFIRETFRAPKVSVQEREGGLFLFPVEEETARIKKTLPYGRGCMKDKAYLPDDFDAPI